MLRNIVLIVAVLNSALLWAQPVVRVVGLFPGAAVLSVDGQRKLLKVGQGMAGDIRLLEADSQFALVSIAGVRQRLTLSREYSESGYSEPEREQLVVARGQGGHYWVKGSVNGSSMDFLLDTGASAIAMNETQARRLGIDFRRTGTPMQVNTASGVEKGWRVDLRSVKAGSIEVLGVSAIVLEGDFPKNALLGMSFLNRVSWRQEQDALVLEAKF